MRRRVLRPIPVITLIHIKDEPKAAVYLYWLLRERPPEANISHGEMPEYSAHKLYVQNHPYRAWYLIQGQCEYVGAIYLTKANEIGIAVFPEYQEHGYASEAIRAVMARYKPKHKAGKTGHGFLANINPKNKRSIRMFKRLGFKLLQHTYELR